MFSKLRAALRAYSDGGFEELGWRTAHFYLAPPEWIGLLELQEGDTVLDVGGYRGHFAQLAAQKVGSSGRVLTIEPDPENLVRLREQFDAFPNVEIVPGAVTSSSGGGKLKIHAENPAAHRMRREQDHVAETGAEGGEEYVSVDTYTLDEIHDRYLIDDPDFIKMDIEGGEIDALRGGNRVLDSTRRVMVEAYHGHPDPDSPDRVCAPEVYQILHRHGFETAVTEDHMVFGWRTDDDRAPLLRRILFTSFSGRYGVDW